jgi:hypothetical protein
VSDDKGKVSFYFSFILYFAFLVTLWLRFQIIVYIGRASSLEIQVLLPPPEVPLTEFSAPSNVSNVHRTCLKSTSLLFSPS